MPTQEPAPASIEVYTRAEAAKLLKTSLRRIDELLASGAIIGKRDGARTKIEGAELRRYWNDLPSYEPGVSA